MKYIYIVAVIFILLLSAVFRLGFVNTCRWGGDEDTIACETLNFINNHRVPNLLSETHGIRTISVSGVWFYLVMLFARDPRIITAITIGIPNTIAIILCYFFCSRFIDRRTAILSTALFGFSNWAIIYSKNLWGVNLLQLISLLTFYILTAGIYKSRLSIIFLSVLFIPILPGFHLTGFSVFISILLILAIYFFYKIKSKYLLISVAIAALISMILFINFIGGRRVLDYILFCPNGKAILTTIDLLVRRWFYIYIWAYPRYPRIEVFNEGFIRIIFIFGCVYIIKKIIEDIKLRRVSTYSIIGIWYFVFIFAFAFADLVTHAHYFMVVLPCLFIIASIGFFSIIDYFSGKNRMGHSEFLLLFLIFAVWSPWISIMLMLTLFFVKKIMRGTTAKLLYFLITFILFFQAFSNIQLFIDMEKRGRARGVAYMDLGAKMNVAKFLIEDAQLRFKGTGLRSYYSTIDDGGYGYNYILTYLDPKSSDFISMNKIDKGYLYTIIGDVDNFKDHDILKNSLYYKKIGPKLVIVEKINEV